MSLSLPLRVGRFRELVWCAGSTIGGHIMLRGFLRTSMLAVMEGAVVERCSLQWRPRLPTLCLDGIMVLGEACG